MNGDVPTLENIFYPVLEKYSEKDEPSGKIKDNELYVFHKYSKKGTIFM